MNDPMNLNCPHAVLVPIESYGEACVAFQCSACLHVFPRCGDCGTPRDSGHASHRTGCTKCGRGRFCNVRRPICDVCAPAQMGVCVECSKPFAQTGRQARAGKAYCGKACRDRAYRERRQARAEAVPGGMGEAVAP